MRNDDNSKLENSTGVSHLVDCSKTAASNTGVSHPVHTIANMTAASMSDLVKLEVCRTLQDVNKRKLNVVVSGIPEMDGNCYNDSNDGDNRKHDCDAFIQFCEENLADKPPLGHKGCKRLGKCIDHRPRKLLVHLTSETSAANLMNASKTLRRTAETANFYINPDYLRLKPKLHTSCGKNDVPQLLNVPAALQNLEMRTQLLWLILRPVLHSYVAVYQPTVLNLSLCQ